MREMKNSGVEWIGEIPSTWRVMPLKALFSFGKGLPITKENLEEAGVPVISYGQIHAKWNSGVTTHDNLLRYVNRSYLESNPQSLVQMGDFIMADTSEDREGCGNCAYIDVKDVLFAGYHTIILRSNYNTDNKYLAYLFLTDSWRSQIRKSVSGVKLFSISRRILGSVSVLLPDNTKPIVHYLDSKCSQIDTLIQNVQTQIEKLKTYKQSLITEVVTKGLDPTVPMKDSGVEWIGEIPEHWQITRLKHLYDTSSGSPVRVGPFGSALPSSELTDEGVWVYNQRTVIDQNFSTNNTFVSPEKASELTSFSVYPKDILITTRGSIGKTAIVPNNAPKGILHPCVIRFRIADDKMDRVLLSLIFNETNICQGQIMDMSNSTTIEVLYSYSLKEIWIPCPPTYEQGEILQQVKKIIQNFARLIAIKQAKIEKLEQYKRSLIYEYVTGKKEVRL